ncbi:IMPACT family protein [Wenzhouxiangella sediminis]|uniref:YigZ family protein n=1 Tax=Wenzhouxiangella sediminis TaxID=1792836 RepID=A0A3E1K5H2_9GAMM|nr:YigZ family protein [Wenzhouxiangella sediminis]RFF29259.1 YigZ family protein [Wenzhouxiangella sediminis]
MSHRLIGPVTHEAEIKKSRFIAHAAPVDDEDAARAFIERVSDPTANHNCWAWLIGDNYRFDDDGEPGGTAGRPILQAIESQGYDRTVVVVTRFFGGTKLGTGGLARAYGGTANEALRTAESTPIVPKVRLRLNLPFEFVGAAHHALSEFGGEKLSEDYDTDGVTLIVTVPAASRQAFSEHIRDAAKGQGRVARI